MLLELAGSDASASFSCSASAVFTAGRSRTTTAVEGLGEQVREIKSEVLSIAQELNRLEEKVLYPSGTQVAKRLRAILTARRLDYLATAEGWIAGRDDRVPGRLPAGG
jgi:hypothetical protein